MKRQVPVRTASWKPFVKLLMKSHLPWWLYIFQAVIVYYSSKLTVFSMDAMGKITAGAIMEDGLIGEFIWANGLSLCLSIVPILVAYVTILFEHKVQVATWKSFIDLPIKIYEQLVPSSLISRVTQDSIIVGRVIDEIMMLIQTIFFTILSIKTMFDYSASLTKTVLPLAMAYAIFFIFGRDWIFSITYYLQEAFSELTGYFAERLGNIKLIKASGTECIEELKGKQINDEKFRVNLSQVRYDVFLISFQQLISVLLTGLVLIKGNMMVQSGEMKLEALISYYIFSMMMPDNFQMIFQSLFQIRGIKGATTAVAEISDLEKETITRQIAMPQGDAIELKQVHFHYVAEEPILKGVTATIPLGKSTAIVGMSGCGKTTLLKLLERFYEPTQGTIEFGGHAIHQIHLDEWRDKFGYIIQNSPLLSGTLRENILYGARQEVSEARLQQVIAITKIDEFLDELEAGLDTDIGEMGMKLSGGQRQRIAIARALISYPDILLMDEATANIDAANEMLITTQIMDFMQDKTVVIVAHNLNTIVAADHIIVMEQGKVVAQGTYQALYQDSMMFRRFIDLQQDISLVNTATPTPN